MCDNGADLPTVPCETCGKDVAIHPTKCLDCLDEEGETVETIPVNVLKDLIDEWLHSRAKAAREAGENVAADSVEACADDLRDAIEEYSN